MVARGGASASRVQPLDNVRRKPEAPEGQGFQGASGFRFCSSLWVEVWPPFL